MNQPEGMTPEEIAIASAKATEKTLALKRKIAELAERARARRAELGAELEAERQADAKEAGATDAPGEAPGEMAELNAEFDRLVAGLFAGPQRKSALQRKLAQIEQAKKAARLKREKKGRIETKLVSADELRPASSFAIEAELVLERHRAYNRGRRHSERVTENPKRIRQILRGAPGVMILEGGKPYRSPGRENG